MTPFSSPPFPTPGRRPAGRGFCALAFLGLVALGLAGCAGSENLIPSGPPQTHVPVAAGDAFPNLSGPQDGGRRPTLSPEERSRLERDLDSTAKERQRRLREKLESDG